VAGDALCALNPVFGQGQTLAVLEAELLQSLLAAGRNDVSSRFFTRVAELLAEPWETATGESGSGGRPSVGAGIDEARRCLVASVPVQPCD
jgi:hypothetical protein